MDDTPQFHNNRIILLLPSCSNLEPHGGMVLVFYASAGCCKFCVIANLVVTGRRAHLSVNDQTRQMHQSLTLSVVFPLVRCLKIELC
ncbi:hypothetical protein OG21DRAFT_912318 [Imleria badia]|jgi:hypothetical protein|nr:hypothetical protein OG21DRAFT_912318 [Imleria badia]